MLASSKRKCKIKVSARVFLFQMCKTSRWKLAIQGKIVKIIRKETKNSLHVFKAKFEETKMYLLSAQCIDTVRSIVSAGSSETNVTEEVAVFVSRKMCKSLVLSLPFCITHKHLQLFGNSLLSLCKEFLCQRCFFLLNFQVCAKKRIITKQKSIT